MPLSMRLPELRSALKAFAARFDPALISARQAATVVEHAAAIKHIAGTIEALAAGRVAETELWQEDGDRSPAHQLARKTGTSVSQAQETLATAKRLHKLPAVTAAAKQGQLSAQQSAAIADAASADPESEQTLLECSQRSSLGELREACARTKANATDPEARRRRIHEQRRLRTYGDAEGAGNMHVRDNPEVIAEIMACLEPIRDELFEAARAEGRREPLEAYAADALVELVRRFVLGEAATGGTGRTKMLVRVDLPALLRSYPVGAETCEIVGYGPVAVSALRDMIDTGDPFLAAVVTSGERVLGVAHLGRRVTAKQRSALEWLYPTCAVEGCNGLTFLEVDHRIDWSRTHTTLLELLDRLCRHHHDLKTVDGWMLVDGTGKRAFVPPDDPRHPRNAHSPPVAAA